MSESPNPKPSVQNNKWRLRFYGVIAAWLITTVAMSFSPVRAWVAYPLYVHDAEATGEAAYVMADGPAYWERLHAAADLYHWDRVGRIIILEENDLSQYNFVLKRSESRLERSVSYLRNLGVPSDRISTVPIYQATRLGSLSEARGVAEHYPDLKQIVVVTSAPHTRRSKLCFERTLSDDTTVEVYAASEPVNSAEIHSPLWIEYVKLVIYFVAA